MKFIIGTGYHYSSQWNADFFEIWKENTEKYSKNYYCICTNKICNTKNTIFLNHNLGHVGSLIKNNKDGLSGWSQSILTLALIAYGADSDLVFKESDCLFFGDVIGQMYRDCGDKGMVFGASMKDDPWMPCAQSAFLIKKWYLLDFVKTYLEISYNDKDILTEQKFCMLEEKNPNNFARLSFGVDRMRPIPWDEKVWYCQQWQPNEVNELGKRYFYKSIEKRNKSLKQIMKIIKNIIFGKKIYKNV